MSGFKLEDFQVGDVWEMRNGLPLNIKEMLDAGATYPIRSGSLGWTSEGKYNNQSHAKHPFDLVKLLIRAGVSVEIPAEGTISLPPTEGGYVLEDTAKGPPCTCPLSIDGISHQGGCSHYAPVSERERERARLGKVWGITRPKEVSSKQLNFISRTPSDSVHLQGSRSLEEAFNQGYWNALKAEKEALDASQLALELRNYRSK